MKDKHFFEILLGMIANSGGRGGNDFNGKVTVSESDTENAEIVVGDDGVYTDVKADHIELTNSYFGQSAYLSSSSLSFSPANGEIAGLSHIQFGTEGEPISEGSISGLGLPLSDDEAANKQYVDAAVSPFDHETWTFTLSGGTTLTKEVVTWTSQT